MSADVASKAKMEDMCRLKGVRLTRQRKIIIEAIANSPDHLSVEALHQQSNKKDEKISLATVYRTIKMLEKSEAIERHTFVNNNRSLVEKAKSHHDHFINIKDGKITEFRSDEIERLQRKIAARHGFEIVHHRLEIYVRPKKSASNSSNNSSKNRDG